jgi:hypothetical integral membrane protein (TIGR02206 family)
MLQLSDIVHVGALVLLVLSIAKLLRSAWRFRDSIWGEILDRALLLFIAFFWLAFVGYRFFARAQLPLNVADLTGLIAAPSLAIKRWPLRAILYYWGIGLCAPALLAPVLRLVSPYPDMWFYWLGSGAIITAAVYDLAVNRYRPKWRDWIWACLAAWTYVGIVLSIDLLQTANYGIVGSTLGPWPQRIVPAMGLVAVLFFLMTLPWVFLSSRPRSAPRPIVPEPEDSELVYST